MSTTSAVQTESIRNDKVIVTDCVLAPRQQLSIRGTRPSVSVYFTDAKVKITLPDGKSFASEVKKGAATFQADAGGGVQNVGSDEIRFLRIEFVGNGLDETWGAREISPNYNVLLENRYARVYQIQIAAGAKEPLHTHRARVVVCMSGAKMRHYLPDGSEEPSGLRTGEFAWRLGQTHVGQNLDTKDLWVIAVEPK